MGDWRRMGVGVKRGADELIVGLDPAATEPGAAGDATAAALAGHRDAGGPLAWSLCPARGPAWPSRAEVCAIWPCRPQGRFELTVACDSGDGVYQLEIEGDDGHGPEVLANFPLYCGVEPPARIAVTGNEVTRRQDAAEAERELLALLNRDRAAAGLPALQATRVCRRSPAATAARWRARAKWFTYRTRAGSAVDRVRAAHVSPFPRTLAENVGRAFSTAEVEHGFMGSPSHRANILNPDMTHVGIGVAVGQAEGGVVPLFFTQLFAGW